MGVRADPWNGGAEPPDKNAPPGPAGTAFSLAGIPVLRGFRPLGSSRLPPPLTARRLRWERSHCLPRPICAHKEKTNSSKVRYYPDLNLRSRGKPRGCAQVVESAPAVRDRRAQKRAPGGLARRGLSGQARALCGPAPAARRAPSPFVFNSSSSTASPRPPGHSDNRAGSLPPVLAPRLHPHAQFGSSARMQPCFPAPFGESPSWVLL